MARRPAILQPAPVSFRLIQLAPLGGPGAEGALGRVWKPLRPGMNGDAGWQSGSYNLRCQEEGALTVTFPNAAGDDGELHRRRFKVLSDKDYRPGEEWLECWHGNELQFVMTPVTAKVTRQEVTVSGYDLFWTLKKIRDGAVCPWVDAPHIVLKHYAGIWQSTLSDDFGDEDNVYTLSSAIQNSTDGVWEYVRVKSDYVSHPSAVEMRPRDTSASYLKSLNNALGNLGTSRYWRVETRFVVETDLEDSQSAVSLRLESVAGSGAHVHMDIRADDRVYTEVSQTNAIGFVGSVTKTPTWKTAHAAGATFDVKIEGRDRWILFFVNGQLVNSLPYFSDGSAGDWYAMLVASVSPGSDVDRNVIVLENLLFRKWREYGIEEIDDWRVPGAPPPDGLLADYFAMSSKRSRYETTDDRGLAFKPDQEPYARRVETVVAKPSAPDYGDKWWPAGPAKNDHFAVRWGGAIYLRLFTHGYKFRVHSDDGARLWVGDTSFLNPVIDDWGPEGGGHAMDSGFEDSAGMSIVLGTRTGWYPIRLEFREWTGEAGIGLRYQRGDQEGLWLFAGQGAYPHALASIAPSLVDLWLMDDLRPTNNANSANAYKGHHGLYPNGGLIQHGPVRGSRAVELNGTDELMRVPYTSDLAVGDNFAFVCAIKRGRTGAGSPDTIVSNGGFQLAIKTDDTLALVQEGAGDVLNAGAGNKIANKDWHLVGVMKHGATARLYIDGVKVASTGASGVTIAGSTADLNLGRRASGADMFFKGRLYGAVLLKNGDELTDAVMADMWARWDDPPDVLLSPIGLVNAEYRYPSGYEQFQEVASTFGFQYRVLPRSLESGSFPGVIEFADRVGSDSDLEITDDDVLETPTRDVAADDVADALLMDGLGFGDQETQVTMEDVDYGNLNHPWISEEYESASDVDVRSLLLQRLDSLLALRGSPWENVSARPPGHRQRTDSFPLTGELSLFKWLPGDGVRLKLDSIDVEDASPRQMLGLERELRPAGLAPPTISFRQRPRNLRETLRRLFREVKTYKRHRQGGYTILTGNLAAQPTLPGVPVDDSRCSLPHDIHKVIRATLVVHTYSGSGSMPIRVNGTLTPLSADRPDRIDLSSWVEEDPVADARRMYVTLDPSGSDAATYVLELLVLTRGRGT